MNNTEKAFFDNMEMLRNAVNAASAAIRRCDKCMWWLAGERTDEQGECRKNPPESVGWPGSYADDWCGSYEYDTSKDKEA